MLTYILLKIILTKENLEMHFENSYFKILGSLLNLDKNLGNNFVVCQAGSH